MAPKMQARLQKLQGILTTQRDWQNIEFTKTTCRDNLRLIMRGYANKTSEKQEGCVRSLRERAHVKLQAHFVPEIRP